MWKYLHSKKWLTQEAKEYWLYSVYTWHVYIMVTVNTAASTGDVVKRNRFWWGRMALCVTRCTRAGTPVVGCPQQQVLSFGEFLQTFPSRYCPHTPATHRCTPIRKCFYFRIRIHRAVILNKLSWSGTRRQINYGSGSTTLSITKPHLFQPICTVPYSVDALPYITFFKQ